MVVAVVVEVGKKCRCRGEVNAKEEGWLLVEGRWWCGGGAR